MKRKLAALTLLCFTVSVMAPSAALAKNDKSQAKSEAKMPSLPMPAQAAQGYEAAKKAIEEASKGPSLKEEILATAAAAADALRNAAKKAEKTGPQRGDPKTAFSASENKRHSAKHRSPEPEVVAGWTPTATNVDPETGNTVVTYEPPVTDTSDADYVVVEYSPAGTPVSAVSYTVTESFSVPDLTDMTLVRTDLLQNGESIETYGYPVYEGDTTQVTTWIVMFYDPAGNFLKARMQVAQTLAL